MNKDPYAVALNNALTEIKKVCPDVSRSFIFTKDGKIVAGDTETDEKIMEKMIHSFQSLAEKAETIGSLKTFYVDGENGKIILSSINDRYLVLAASKNADTTYLNAITHVIIPTILKLLETITPTPLQFETSKQLAETSKQLVVDTLSGFFIGDAVQIDTQILEEWAKLLNQKSVNQVEIESFGGKSTQCKVKEINETKMKGKEMIRIPEKLCKTLEVKKGELVKVKPTST
jgi:predicted regulator of Ras-like GTPase activity (Roadblock/LC7/MglB family)/DNA-binding Xre family transcriptional regulator